MSGETAEQMELKYEGVHAHEITSWIHDGVIDNVKGFRLVRKMRKQDTDEPGWSTIEVCNCSSARTGQTQFVKCVLG